MCVARRLPCGAYNVNMRQDCRFKSLAGNPSHKSGHAVSFRVQQLEAGVLIQLDSGNVRDDGDLGSAWRYFFRRPSSSDTIVSSSP